MKSVRVVEVGIDHVERPVPLFVFAESSVTTPKGVTTKRAHIHRDDLKRHDPAFMSAIGYHIQRVSQALIQLEGLSVARYTPKTVTRLVKAMRSSLDEYLSSVDAIAAE